MMMKLSILYLAIGGGAALAGGEARAGAGLDLP